MKPTTATEALEQAAETWYRADEWRKQPHPKDSFKDGVAWARANDPEVLTLVEALRETSRTICKPISMTDALMQLSEIETRCDKALAAFAKRAEG